MLLFQKNVTAQFIASVDSYLAGQFKDDQFQGSIQLNKSAGWAVGGSSGVIEILAFGSRSLRGYNTSGPGDDSTNGPPRYGKTTRGKQIGTNYLIKY